MSLVDTTYRSETMSEQEGGKLADLHVLVVEDEHLVAMALAADLEDAGAIVLGPASTIESALALIEQHPVDAAVLDIKLRAQMVFPVAEVLADQGVPFLFMSGLDDEGVPERYAAIPKCNKPSTTRMLTEMLVAIVGR